MGVDYTPRVGVGYTPRVGIGCTPRVGIDDTPRVGYGRGSRVGYFCLYIYLIFPTFRRYSAICTAFSAAPLRIWSLTVQKERPLGLVRSLRIRPT